MAPAPFVTANHGTELQYSRAFAFDGDSSGKHDHLFLYTPESGACCVVKSEKGQLRQLYKTASGGAGGFGFGFKLDRAIPFDYDSSGKLDHIILFRPGAGACFIVKSERNGKFKSVYRMPAAAKAGPHAGRGLGPWPLRMPWEKMFAFDYNHSRKLDHVCIYRRLQGVFVILGHEKGQWKIVHQEGNKGIGGYGLASEADYAQAIDWNSTGHQNCILICRFCPNYPHNLPAHAVVVAHQGAKFVVVWKVSNIAGLNPFARRLKAFPLDFMGTGHMNHIGLYCQGQGLIWILQGGKHVSVKYKAGTTTGGTTPTIHKGQGIGGCTTIGGRCIAFDFQSKGRNDHIFVYGAKEHWVIGRGSAHSPAANPHSAPRIPHGAPAHPPAAAGGQMASQPQTWGQPGQGQQTWNASQPQAASWGTEWASFPNSQSGADEQGDFVPDLDVFPKNEAGEPMDTLTPEELANRPEETPEMDVPVVDQSDEASAGII